MNTIFALLVFMLCLTASAQESVQEWQAKAIEKFPALGVQGSDFNKAFVAEYERRKQTSPEAFRDAYWPMLIANSVHLKLRTEGENPASKTAVSDPKTPAPPQQTTTGAKNVFDQFDAPRTTAPLGNQASGTPKPSSDALPAPPPGFVLDGSTPPVPAKEKHPFDPSKPFEVVGTQANPADFEIVPSNSPAAARVRDAELRQAAESLALAKRATMWRWAGLAAVAIALLGLIGFGARIPWRSGRIPRLLPALRAVLDRQLTTRAILTVTVILLVASWLYPPGFHVTRGSSSSVSRGWFFLFDTSSAMQVDFGRLILLDAIIAVCGLSLARTASINSPSRGTFVRLAFYSLVAVPMIALVCGVAFLSVSVIPQAASWANQPWKTAPVAVGDTEEKDDWGGIAVRKNNRPNAVGEPGDGPWKEFAVKPSKYDDLFDDLPNASAKKKRSGVTFLGDLVEADDLPKLSLFDIGVDVGYPDSRSVRSIHGRVRSTLSRTVDKLTLKASFYNAQKELLEVKTFDVNKTVSQDAPASFDELSTNVRHLPGGWTCKVEIVAAKYVK